MEAVAKLKNYPTSPRKMRLLADLIRGMNVEKALAELEHNSKHPAVPLRKLVVSAISNWKQKNDGGDESALVVKTIMVDCARVLKRMRPAPQGREDARSPTHDVNRDPRVVGDRRQARRCGKGARFDQGVFGKGDAVLYGRGGA